MIGVLLGIFLFLHGMVHLLYAGQSGRLFELRPGMTWPDGSWAFARLLGDGTTRGLAVGLLALAALGFAAGGLGLILRQEWGRSIAIGASAFSAVLYLVLWNGRFQALNHQGWIGILIDLGVLAALWFIRP
jgi:hypothetical protein